MNKHKFLYHVLIIQDSFSNLKDLGSRTILALIGIVIGTIAVIAILNIGHNARLASLRAFEDLGLDLVSITANSSGTSPSIDLQTALALPKISVGLSSSAPYVTGGGYFRIGSSPPYANWIGVTQEFYPIMKLQACQGRLSNDLDKSRPVAVLGASILEQIKNARGFPVVIGEDLNIDGQILTVIGMLCSSPSAGFVGFDVNESVLMPFHSAKRFGRAGDIQIVGRLGDKIDDRKAAEMIRFFFQNLPGSRGEVHVNTARDILRNIDQQMKIYTLLLVGIGSISVAVGGVGVMNVMLMNVLERRSETGLRMALGARPKDIWLQFMAESVFLSFAGTCVGAILGTGAGWIFALCFDWEYEIAPQAIPIGVAMALFVGIFFGAYPAIRASRLDPIETLRSG